MARKQILKTPFELIQHSRYRMVRVSISGSPALAVLGQLNLNLSVSGGRGLNTLATL